MAAVSVAAAPLRRLAIAFAGRRGVATGSRSAGAGVWRPPPRRLVTPSPLASAAGVAACGCGDDDGGIDDLFENNRHWAAAMRASDSDCFRKLSALQRPKYLWIGCSDSRVPANVIVDLPPGAVFVHRNIANVVTHTDLNCLSVIEFAVSILRVRHILVVGHDACSGVTAALHPPGHGALLDAWLRHVRDVRVRAAAELAALPDDAARVDRLVELNVAAGVANVAATGAVQAAWARGDNLTVHGWVYKLGDGLLRDLGVSVGGVKGVGEAYRMGPAADGGRAKGG